MTTVLLCLLGLVVPISFCFTVFLYWRMLVDAWRYAPWWWLLVIFFGNALGAYFYYCTRYERLHSKKIVMGIMLVLHILSPFFFALIEEATNY